MILLYTDFGLEGPYVGQMMATLGRLAPGVPVINLMADAPACDPRAAAYLLAALVPDFPPGSVLLGVVDPGVGSARREPVMLECDGCCYVGPGNGLFDIVARRSRGDCRWQRITWRPERLSASFHGRDLFAPVAAEVAVGRQPSSFPFTPPPSGWPEDLSEVVYVDHFGNAMTGLRAGRVPPSASVWVGSARLEHARTFSDRPQGEAFWYENSVGLVEIAANRTSAAEALGLAIGSEVTVAP